jgi:ketosteroid isomerase-like protein
MPSGEELIAEIWARWNSGDRTISDDLFDPELVIYSALTGDVYRGTHQVRRWQQEIDQQFDRWEISAESVEELEPDRFLVLGRIKMRGRESGMPLDQAAGWILELREGRLVSLRNYIGHAAAREAAEES